MSHPTTVRSTTYLALVQAKFQLREAIRIPVSIIMGLVAPSIGLVFFVLPQEGVADDPAIATRAVIGLCIFGIMANGLFQFAVEVSQARERPWGSYTRSLPAGPAPRLLSYVLSSGALAATSIVPLVLLAAVTTSATLSPQRFGIGVAALLLTSIPFMLIGIAVGYLMASKAAVAVSQVLMLLLAFGGGLFIPPSAFPAWADATSMVLPSRPALELTLWATGSGGTHLASSALGWTAWTVSLLGICFFLAKRDQNREY